MPFDPWPEPGQFHGDPYPEPPEPNPYKPPYPYAMKAGIVSYNDTVVYSINGFMGDLWSGPQADTAKYLSNQGLNLAYWQPIGYDSTPIPLNTGVDNALAELQNQFNIHGATDGSTNVLCTSWSEGAIAMTIAYQHSVAGDAGWPPLSAWKGAVTFGNPYREVNNWAPPGTPNPGGAGIGGPRNNLVGTPSWWANIANKGDIYTCCPTDQTGDDMRVIFDFVLAQWNGVWGDLYEFALNLIQQSATGIEAIITAAVDAITFYVGGQSPHVNFSPAEMSYAQNFLAGLAAGLR